MLLPTEGRTENCMGTQKNFKAETQRERERVRERERKSELDGKQRKEREREREERGVREIEAFNY